jgi:hypothetical protein
LIQSLMKKPNQEYSMPGDSRNISANQRVPVNEIFSGVPEKRCIADNCNVSIVPLASFEAVGHFTRFLKTIRLKRCSSPAWGGAPMSDQSINVPPTTLAAFSPAIPPARPVAVRTKLLLEGPIFATLLLLAAPNILNLLAFVGVITFDGYFLGRIGTDALAGASLAFPWIMLVLQTTNSGMGVGVSSAVARALGAGKRERADELAFHAFLLALVLAGIFSTVMLLAAPFIFGWMGGRDNMLTDALSYANVAFGGAV